MLFNSYPFLFVFLPITLFGFFAVARFGFRFATLWLALASVVFYGFWNPKFVLVLLSSVALNFFFGYQISTRRGRMNTRPLLIIAVALNLAVLAFFKYTNFFIANANELAGWQIPLHDIVLPLGISFFTFTQIAFLVDVHRGLAHEIDFINYLLFVTFFPHLIAGPVLHHNQMMPQFRKPSIYRWNSADVAVGCAMFTIGLAKKVLIADSFAEYATPVFTAAQNGEQLQAIEAWAGALAYTLQLYFDFSGYSDMAVGLARLFGIRIPINFNSPYKSGNIIEFWRRWHITLSNFLRDYLYIPLGGNRRGPARRYVNIFITMVLGGLWHGANWTFVVWGALHGALLMINHAFHAIGLNAGRITRWRRPVNVLSVAFTFMLVVAGWVIFRSNNIETALSILQAMALGNGVSVPPGIAERLSALPGLVSGVISGEGFFPVTRIGGSTFGPLLAAGLVIVFALPNSQELILEYQRPTWSRALYRRMDGRLGLRAGIALGLILAACLMSLTSTSEFLYFQF